MTNWLWLDPAILLAAHDEQLAEHGDASGIRDTGMFESALVRTQNLASYGEPDAASLAAAYAFELAKNHAFIDGNKRTATIALEYFLEINGFVLTADDPQCLLVILSVASGAFGEDELAGWIRKHIKTA